MNEMKFEPTFVRWVMIAVAFSLAIAAMTYVLAWRQIIPTVADRHLQQNTLDSLHALQHAIDSYRQHHGQNPPTLRDLREEDLMGQVLLMRESRDPEDFWLHQFEYDKDKGRVVSFGKDGKPGGRWIDADISSTDQSLPLFPLHRFVFAREGMVALSSSLLAAALALLVFYVAAWPKEFTTNEGPPWFRMIAIAIFASILGLFITAVQLSGH